MAQGKRLVRRDASHGPLRWCTRPTRRARRSSAPRRRARPRRCSRSARGRSRICAPMFGPSRPGRAGARCQAGTADRRDAVKRGLLAGRGRGSTLPALRARPRRGAYVRYTSNNGKTFQWSQSCVPMAALSDDLTGDDDAATRSWTAVDASAATWSKTSDACTYLDITVSSSTEPDAARDQRRPQHRHLPHQ